MKTLWNRIPQGWKLAILCAALLLLLFVSWAVTGYHSFDPGTAFRRGLEDACYPPVEMELLAELRCNYYYYYTDAVSEWTLTIGLGTDANNAYLVGLSKERGWRSWACWSTPAVAEDVWYVPLLSSFDYLVEPFRHFMSAYEIDKLMQIDPQQLPCFAVKAPGASASLTLIVDAWEPSNSGSEHTAYGRFPLLLQEHRNGWFLFRFDTEPLLDAQNFDLETVYSPYDPEDSSKYQIQHKEPYASLLLWAARYKADGWSGDPPAHLELTTYDEAGRILKILQWDLSPAE